MKQIATIVCLMLTLSVSATNQQPGQQPPQVQQPAQVQRFTMQQRQAWGQWQNRNRQQNQPQPNRSGQFSPAEYWKQQKEFFTQRAGLTEEEANAFFPLYNELQQKKRELNHEIRTAMRPDMGAQPSEEQSLKAIDAMADVNIRIAELEKEYLQKFKKVLPASKILKVQIAEEQFNSQILKDIQQSRGHQFQQAQPFNQQAPSNNGQRGNQFRMPQQNNGNSR